MRNILSPFRSLLVLLFAALGVATSSAQMLDGSGVYENVKYVIDYSAKTAEATGITSNLPTIEIQDCVLDKSGMMYPVVSIGTKAFENVTELNRLNIGSNVREIKESAFYNCVKLTDLIIPEGVEVIGKNAFMHCDALTRVELPSTLKTLTAGSFTYTKIAFLKIGVANYDSSGSIVGLNFNESAFPQSIFASCRLSVPKRAESWYRQRSINGKPNWGYRFLNIETFGTPPTDCIFYPSQVTSYNDLSKVSLKFVFADANLKNNVALGNNPVRASLVVDGVELTAAAEEVSISNNIMSINFANILQVNKDRFVAKTEGKLSTIVALKLEGEILVEDSPFSLKQYFAYRPIVWSVPLLPAVNELGDAPVVTLQGVPDNDNVYTYDSFNEVTLTFNSFESVSLDAATGAGVVGQLYKDGQPIATNLRSYARGNSVHLTFNVPYSELLVRKSSGIETYDFGLTVEGQIHASDSKNYRFTVPFNAAGTQRHYTVHAVYYPEPQGISFSPAVGTQPTMKELSHLDLKVEGVKNILLSYNTLEAPIRGSLFRNGVEVATITSNDILIEDNIIHIVFPETDDRLVSFIGTRAKTYDFSLGLSAYLLADGYPCRMQIGSLTGDDDDLPEATDDLLVWNAPHWTVNGIAHDVPKVSVSTPLAGPNGPFNYEDLRTVVLTVDNYKTVALDQAEDDDDLPRMLSAKLVRYGDPVCTTDSISVDGNRIIINFGSRLTYNAVGISPDDEANNLIELSLDFAADLLFDGIPYRLLVNRKNEGTIWKLVPIVVRQIPTPTILFEEGQLSFTCPVEGVTYHYSITNPDASAETKVPAIKSGTGSFVVVPMTRVYDISVYASRKGYEDSEVSKARLYLDDAPKIEKR